MRKTTLYGFFGDKDTYKPSNIGNEEIIGFNLLNTQGELRWGIGEAIKDVIKLGGKPIEIGIDLLVIAAHTQAADSNISRKLFSQDSWTREIKLIIPVADPTRWNAVSDILKRMLDFLTGDIWYIEFRPRLVPLPAYKPKLRALLAKPKASYEYFSLFSGGLDSLIGAIDLVDSKRNALFISHAGDAATSKAQKDCFVGLQKAYPESTINRLRAWMDLSRINKGKTEKTTRGRSFLFIAVGFFVGTSFSDSFVLRIPENGLIALNVPLDVLRLGSNSTRTTHPFYLARWNDLLACLGISGKVENPFWNKTKGEMVSECANKTLLTELAPISLSCSSPTKGRYHGQPTQHCGYCLPCLIRRASLVTGMGADSTAYSAQRLDERLLDTLQAEGKQVRSFQVAIKRLKERPSIAKILIHKAGSLADESLERQAYLADVYRRGMYEVDTLLTGVKTQPIREKNV